MLLVAAVQFINVVEFVLVSPLGPRIAADLEMAQHQVGLINGSYSAAAAVAGLLGAFFLDRFDRRVALGVAMLGLVAGTALGGAAQSLPMLMGARLLAGAFGGPATALSYAIIADVIPPERRGRAVAVLMGAFSVGSVVGVPLAIRVSDVWGWRAAFWSVAGIGVLVVAGAVFLLPPVRRHLGLARPEVTWRSLVELLGRPLVRSSYAMTALAMVASFSIIPALPVYLQLNLDFPAERMFLPYFVGGIASFASMQVAGRLVDRFGSFRVGLFAAAAVIAVLGTWWWGPPTVALVVVTFAFFMGSMSFRNVAYNTLATKVPEPHERARFQSFQSFVQHVSMAFGGFLSTQLLHEVPRPEGVVLAGVPRLLVLSMALNAALPFVFRVVESRVRARHAAVPAPPLADH